jgi:AmiR/NasT family two-component response regulator
VELPVTRELDERNDIARAVGMVMEEFQVDSVPALSAIVRCSERTGVDIVEVSQILINMGERVGRRRAGSDFV